jgi:hypothetical protein
MNMQRCAMCGKKFDNVHGKCPTCAWESKIDSQPDTLHGVNELGLQDIRDLVEMLEAEVNNGGFHQFFYNSAGDKTAETIQALEAIGAFTTADIVNRAAQRFPWGTPPKDRFARQDVLLEAFPHATAFEELDREFFAYRDDLPALITKYNTTRD